MAASLPGSSKTTASPLSNDECRAIVKKHLKREDFEVRSFTVSPLSADMRGFMGEHLKLRISVSLVDQESKGVQTTELQFFVKPLSVDNTFWGVTALSSVAHQKEVLFHGALQRGVEKHLRSTEEESSTYFGTVPRCYYWRHDLLVQEDLTLAGFRKHDLHEPLSVAECECGLKALARLHAASLIFEEREGRRLSDVYPMLLVETIFQKVSGFPVGLPVYGAQVFSRRVAHILLDYIPRFAPGTSHNEELHGLLGPTMESIYELLKPSDKYRNVLCHRDLWVNNLLFTENAKGELSVRLMNFKTMHLEPPAQDVAIFLHLVLMRDVRRAYEFYLLKAYHETLVDVLTQHDLDANLLMPRQVFLQSYYDAKPVAVILATYILQVAVLPVHKTALLGNMLLDHTRLVMESYQQDQRYRTRIRETMEQLVEVCLLPRLQDQDQQQQQ